VWGKKEEKEERGDRNGERRERARSRRSGKMTEERPETPGSIAPNGKEVAASRTKQSKMQTILEGENG
jgi:hypothetical protein